MRKLFLLLGCGICTVSCIDSDYDFGNISTDNIAIGDENSEFKIPLALIRIGTDEISGNGADLSTFFNEADTWLCDPLPDGATSIDIGRVQSDPAYFDALTRGLLQQMKTDDAKMEAVTSLIFDKYRDEFVVPALPTGNITKEEYQTAFKELFRADIGTFYEQLSEQISQTSRQYLSALEQIEPTNYSIGRIDIDSDMLDMIIGKAGDDDTVVRLYGTIVSHLPATLQLHPAFQGTAIAFEVTVTPQQTCSFEPVGITKKDLRQMLDDAQINIPISLRTYSPRTFDPSLKEPIVMQLSMHKLGALSFDI